MFYQLIAYYLFTLTYVINGINGVIVAPCKVKNLMVQPEYGTSMRTKDVVNIVQIPPVFVQNIMVGICENHNETVPTGSTGEYYTCQQRYSVVEVYIAESSVVPVPLPPHSYPEPNPADYFDVEFIRETVVVESGCDFVFNAVPVMESAPSHPSKRQANLGPFEKKSEMGGPFRLNPGRISPPDTAVPVPPPQPPQGVPVANPYEFLGREPVRPYYAGSPKTNAQARKTDSVPSNLQEDVVIIDDPSNEDSTFL